MNIDGDDFNYVMKFVSIIGLIGFSVWVTKSPWCLIGLIAISFVD